MEVYGAVNSWFWDESFWLPRNITWDDIKPSKEHNYANFNDLIYPFPLAIVFIIIRKLFERFFYEKLGRYCGLKDNKKRKAPENTILEKAFKENAYVEHKKIQDLARQLDWSERQVERWLRYRNLQDKPSVLTKFTESGWRATYYFLIVVYGFWILWDKPWLWNSRQCWIGFPKHEVASEVWWYYMVSLGFYWSLAISQHLEDVKRKDFLEMFIHHWVTISLLSFSWSINMTRIGTIVLLVHDVADPLLEVAKMTKYVNHQFLCNILFTAFTFVWVISRLMIFPYVVLHSTIYEAGDIMYPGSNAFASFPSNIIFNAMMILLQILHILWTVFIIRVLIRAASAGKLVKDERSEDSCSISDSSISDSSEPEKLSNNSSSKKEN